MANTIKIKRNTGSTAPTTSNIAQGELAISESNKILFYRDASDNILKIGGEGAFLRSDESDTLTGNLTNKTFTYITTEGVCYRGELNVNAPAVNVFDRI